MSLTTPFAYRPEIDGLRAIAVLAVVLYHFGVPGLRGGFVGVDVFFVISGFLIGGLLWREGLETGKIGLRQFYVRRIKRLAPAFVAMSAAALLVAYFVLLPFEFRAFGKSLIAATVYLSNVNFFREAGYFDSASEDKVLLHTWSLSVEEQFYIFLPLIMLVLLRRPIGLRAVLWGLFAVSLAACLWITPRSQTAAFYLFPFRAWELLAGVLLAIEAQRRAFAFSLTPAASYAGLALVLSGVVLIPASQAFPGVLAVVPVLGAVLLIANGQNANWINRALASPPAVAIGLISYSLYLWHWPVLTLSRYYRGTYSGALEVAGWLALSGVLAYLSWRYVERPARRSSFGTTATFGAALAASAALIAAGGIIFKQNGMIARFDAPLRTHIEASADFLQDWSRCTVPSTGAFSGIEVCPIGPAGTPRVLIWGDSHVRALKEGLEQAAYEADTPALVIWRAGCAPVFGLSKTESAATTLQNEACTNANNILQTALSERAFDHIVLVGRWGYYTNGGGTGLDAGNTIELSVTGANGTPAEQFATGLRNTARQLQQAGHNVFIVKAIPEIANYDSRLIARALAGRRLDPAELQNRLAVPRSSAADRSAPLARTFAELDAQGAILLDPEPLFCDASTCSALFEGAGQYFDNNHIVNAAARRIRSLFDPIWTGP